MLAAGEARPAFPQSPEHRPGLSFSCLMTSFPGRTAHLEGGIGHPRKKKAKKEPTLQNCLSAEMKNGGSKTQNHENQGRKQYRTQGCEGPS